MNDVLIKINFVYPIVNSTFNWDTTMGLWIVFYGVAGTGTKHCYKVLLQ